MHWIACHHDAILVVNDRSVLESFGTSHMISTPPHPKRPLYPLRSTPRGLYLQSAVGTNVNLDFAWADYGRLDNVKFVTFAIRY